MANRVQPSKQSEKRANAAPVSIMEQGERLVHKAVEAAGTAYSAVHALAPGVMLRKGLEKAKEALKKVSKR